MSFFPGKGQYISRKSGITKRRVTWTREGGNEGVQPDDNEPCLTCINQRRMEAERENAIPIEMDEDVVHAAPNSPEADSCRIIIKLSNDEDDSDDDSDDDIDDDDDDEVAMDEHDYGSGNGCGNGSGAGHGNGHHYNYGNGSGVGNGSHSNGNGGDGGNAGPSASGTAGGSASGSAGGASSSAGDSGHGSNVTRQSGSGRSDPEPEPVAGPSSGYIPCTSIVNYGASTSGLVPSSFEDEEEGKRPKKKVCAPPMDLDDDDDFDEDSDPNNNNLQRIPTPLLYGGYYYPVDDPSGITQDDWNEAGPSGVNAGASTSAGPSGAYQTSDSSFSSSCSHHSLVDRYTHMNISGCEDQTDDECAFSESGDDADDLEDD
ncbi:hyphally regulated cell wall protein 3 [Tetranychus urticae]|uniref:Uncharacterized protein n=1 Tax=Tetranychus urticae TaxID=32264 RepID=T1KV17_TETUR|nr:hyphally regulated cell wall protein 3 [Tetranychus urticae]